MNLTPWQELPTIAALSRRGRKAMEDYQERQLLRLIPDVYAANAFYRRLWNETGFNPRHFKSREGLDRLPLVAKQQARTLQSIDGREIDRLRLSNGDTLHAYVLLNILLESDADGWIRQYQVVQDKPGVIEAHIWPVHPPDSAVLKELAARLEKAAEGAVIHIKVVDKMDLDRNGKFHLCRCLV